MSESLDSRQKDLLNKYISQKVDEALENQAERAVTKADLIEETAIFSKDLEAMERRLAMLVGLLLAPLYIAVTLIVIKLFSQAFNP
jgi:hypothetical protein